jgi:hypothetical protein
MMQIGLCVSHISTLLLGLATATALLCAPPAYSADEAATPAQAPTLLHIYAQDSAGNDIADATSELDAKWHIFSCGDPLGLEAQGPLSDQPFKPAHCPPGEINTMVNYQVMILPPGTAQQCPYGLIHPSGHLYLAKLPNGGLVILRLQPSSQPARAWAVFDGKEIDMQPLKPLDFARLQLRGTEPKRDTNNVMPEDSVTRQDVRSLVAFSDGKGQKAELLDAAQVVADLLAFYHKRHGLYPASLDGLTADVDGVIYALPRNPYKWSVSLGAKPPTPALPYGVVYFAELTAPDERVAQATGYWLAVTGKAGDAQPTTALPEGVKAPAHVIRWLEQHTTATP